MHLEMFSKTDNIAFSGLYKSHNFSFLKLVARSGHFLMILKFGFLNLKMPVNTTSVVTFFFHDHLTLELNRNRSNQTGSLFFI